jgi:predicted nucleic acid-binding protein
MAVARFLADKSALARLDREPVARRLGPLIEAGLVATCGIVEVEVLFSARNFEEYEAVHSDRRAGYERLPMPDEVWDRVLEVQRELARRSALRAVKIPDLLVAATAERHGVTVVHYDQDFDLIAEITGQPTEWVIPRGSVA